ncbi:MAG TPA: hypothetical protein VGM78_02535 [Ilumatobacteraceae bacterium]|jgi:hypothetical protein
MGIEDNNLGSLFGKAKRLARKVEDIAEKHGHGHDRDVSSQPPPPPAYQPPPHQPPAPAMQGPPTYGTPVGINSIAVTGYLTGSVEHLRVRAEQNEFSGGLSVSVEAEAPVSLGPLQFNGFNFEIPNAGRDGTYAVGTDSTFEAQYYELYLEGAQDTWYYHPDFGSGIITVNGTSADVSLAFGNGDGLVALIHGVFDIGPH